MEPSVYNDLIRLVSDISDEAYTICADHDYASSGSSQIIGNCDYITLILEEHCKKEHPYHEIQKRE